MDGSQLGRYESLTDLTSIVAKQSKIVEDALKLAGQEVSIRDSDPLAYPMETNTDHTFQRARLDLMEAARQIYDLMIGPKLKAWDDGMIGCHLGGVLRIFHLYKIPENVPLDRPISYAELSYKVDIDEEKLRRIIQYAITHNYFHQPSPGHVSHTACSRLLAVDQLTRDISGHFTDDVFPVASCMPEAWAKFGSATNDPDKTAMVVAPHNPDNLTIFDWYKIQPEREKRFGGAMEWWSTRLPSTLSMSSVDDGGALGSTFDWKSLGNAKVVDCGGNRGHTMFEMLRANPNATAVVEDLPSVIETAKAADLPSDIDNVKSRLTSQAWNFFAGEQPVRDGDVYFFRAVFHDWPDKECHQILANLVPVMKKGAKLIINDIVVDGPGEKSYRWESLVRQFDIHMMLVAYSRERSAQQWRTLIEEGMKVLDDDAGKLELEKMKGNFTIWVKV